MDREARHGTVLISRPSTRRKKHGTAQHRSTGAGGGRGSASARPTSRARAPPRPAAGSFPARADLCQAITPLFRPHKSWRLHSPRTALGGGGGSLPQERRVRTRPICPRTARPLRGQAGRRRSGPWGSTTHCNGAPAGHARRCHPLPTRAGVRPRARRAATTPRLRGALRHRYRRWTTLPSGLRRPIVARAGRR